MKTNKKVMIWIGMFLVCAFIIGFGLLYISYKNSLKTPENQINYDEIYKNNEVTETIPDIKTDQSNLHFKQIQDSEEIMRAQDFIGTCEQDVTGAEFKLKEFEELTEMKLQKVFKGFSDFYPKKHKINGGKTGYDFSVHNLEGLSENVYFLATDKEVFEKVSDAEVGEVSGTPVKILFTHNVRNNIQNDYSVNQYSYEVVFARNNMNYYMKIYFSGFDAESKPIEVSAETSSKRVSEILEALFK